MFLKIVIIFLTSFKINFLKQIKTTITEDKIISILFILFIISITISFITSSFTIDLFLYEWLRVRYLDTITDIILFIFLYLYFKDRNINYKSLIKSIIIPGLVFSIFIIYAFIDNKGLSDRGDSNLRYKTILQLKRELTKRPVFETQEGLRDVRITDLDNEYRATVRQYQNINRVAALGVVMADALVKNDKLLYTQIYSRLDKLGIFESNWERKVESGISEIGDDLKKINSSIIDLVDSISGMEENLTSSIEDLSWEISDAIGNVEASIEEKVGKVNEQIENVRSDVSSVHGAIGLSTMLTAYNSYQLNKIRKG